MPSPRPRLRSRRRRCAGTRLSCIPFIAWNDIESTQTIHVFSRVFSKMHSERAKIDDRNAVTFNNNRSEQQRASHTATQRQNLGSKSAKSWMTTLDVHCRCVISSRYSLTTYISRYMIEISRRQGELTHLSAKPWMCTAGV